MKIRAIIWMLALGSLAVVLSGCAATNGGPPAGWYYYCYYDYGYHNGQWGPGQQWDFRWCSTAR